MDILTFLKEPIFWAISAIGSVLLSIIANLLTPYIGSFLSNFSEKRTAKVAKKRLEFLNKIRYVSSNQNRILNQKVDAAYWLLRAIFLLALGIIIFTVSNAFGIFQVIPLIVAAIFIARSSQWVEEAIETYKIAKLATERAEAIRRFEYEWYHEDYDIDDHPNPYIEELNSMLKEWDNKNVGLRIL